MLDTFNMDFPTYWNVFIVQCQKIIPSIDFVKIVYAKAYNTFMAMCIFMTSHLGYSWTVQLAFLLGV